MLQRSSTALLLGLLSPTVAAAEIELSFYLGQQTAPPSRVSIAGDRAIPNQSFQQPWVGQSLEWPVYAGVRATMWRSSSFGIGLDYAHNKVKPPAGTLPAGFSALEFTDGLNTWTINGYRRWQNGLGRATPYVGAGIGLSVPGVEVRYLGSDTFEYQLTGAAATWLAGVSYPLSDKWAVFGEYKGTYTSNAVKLQGGGTLKANILTNALNVGVSFRF